jgi:hypothetical protein
MWWHVPRSGCEPSHSVGELRALVVELVEVNAGPREVIAAKDRQIASLEQRVVELARRVGADSSTSNRPAVVGFAVSQADVALVAQVLGAPAG